jgi:hypothetical protein
MSFSATKRQMRDRTKTVTRRAVGTWVNLKPGDLLLAVEKAQGLKKGERQIVLGVIRVVAVNVEPLSDMGYADVVREGFPGWLVSEFVEMFVRMHPGMTPETEVRRIAFEHVKGAP